MTFSDTDPIKKENLDEKPSDDSKFSPFDSQVEGLVFLFKKQEKEAPTWAEMFLDKNILKTILMDCIEYAEKRKAEENIYFLRDVFSLICEHEISGDDIFKKKIYRLAWIELYERYVDPESFGDINISSECRAKLEEDYNYNKNHLDLKNEKFSQAVEALQYLMNTDIWRSFIFSLSKEKREKIDKAISEYVAPAKVIFIPEEALTTLHLFRWFIKPVKFPSSMEKKPATAEEQSATVEEMPPLTETALKSKWDVFNNAYKPVNEFYRSFNKLAFAAGVFVPSPSFMKKIAIIAAKTGKAVTSLFDKETEEAKEERKKIYLRDVLKGREESVVDENLAKSVALVIACYNNLVVDYHGYIKKYNDDIGKGIEVNKEEKKYQTAVMKKLKEFMECFFLSLDNNIILHAISHLPNVKDDLNNSKISSKTAAHERKKSGLSVHFNEAADEEVQTLHASHATFLKKRKIPISSSDDQQVQEQQNNQDDQSSPQRYEK